MNSVIFTEKAGNPIGPYSQAIRCGNLIFISGQVALNPETGEMMQQDIATETHQVMRNLQSILTAAGADFKHVVKSTIFLTDLNQFSAVNEIYGSYFSGSYPARETVQVSRLPRNANIEISMIAVLYKE
ncbi:MAG: RidA family protein [Bacteroidia bacterium]|nr:RidA family protein [Bacteroidia bacterium]